MPVIPDPKEYVKSSPNLRYTFSPFIKLWSFILSVCWLVLTPEDELNIFDLLVVEVSKDG